MNGQNELTSQDRLKLDMRRAARNIMGWGYTESFYGSVASEFVQIAERYAAEQVEEKRRVSRAKRKPRTGR